MPVSELAAESPLASRATKLSLTAAAIAVLLAGVALIALEYVSLRSALVEQLKAQASIVGDNGAPMLLFGDASAARRLLASLDALPAIEEAQLVQPDGEPLAVWRREGARDGRIDWPANGIGDGVGAVLLGAPVEFDGQHIGGVRLKAGTTQLLERLWGHATMTLLVSVVALALAVVIASSMRGRLRKAEALLFRLKHTDAVTRLPNRHAFNQRLADALARGPDGGALALLLLDLDDFKLVNDTLGHPTGDRLLGFVAARIAHCMRRGDPVCRLGGDEFALILGGCAAQDDVMPVAGKILAALAAPFSVDGREIFVSASIGVSFFPHDAVDAEALVRNADTALYAAKGSGKSQMQLFQPDMRVQADQRLSLDTRLRRALERREFVLHYQPQIELATGRIAGVEALVRWNEGGSGLVPPGLFIPVAEQNGLIGAIGEWVLGEACAQARRWQDAGLPALSIAVNLSARQFDADGLAERVKATVEAAGLVPAQIELELTESALMRNVSASTAALARLADAGFRVAVDDFGTGHSSMAYLKRFPISRLKIDRAFVADITSDPDDAAIVSAIIAMARALQLDVIAEGVETAEQYGRLVGLGVDQVQGYLIARPMPAEEFETWVRRGGFAPPVRAAA